MSHSNTYHAEVTCAGGAGTSGGTLALGTGSPRRLLAVVVKYGGAPATTDLTIQDADRTVLTLTNANTDGVFRPTEPLRDSVGVAIAGAQDAPIVRGGLTMTVAQANNGNVVSVLYILES